ncbi:hypothetical protein ACVGW4_05250, partial [Enterobacter hormaechei]
MRFVALTLTHTHPARGLFGAFLMPAQLIHNQGNDLAIGLDESGLEILLRQVGLVDGSTACILKTNTTPPQPPKEIV